MDKIKKIILLILFKTKSFLTLLNEKILPDSKNNKPIYSSSFKLYEKDEMEKCYNHFKGYFKNSMFMDTNELRKFSIIRAKDNNNFNESECYLEFGVWRGTTINLLSNYVKEIYGFDSFEGLKEDWVGAINKPKGTFSLNKVLPKLNKNVIPIKGWIQDTLPVFLAEKKPKITFMHIDVDTYETTKFILENTKPFLQKNAIILFDELYNFPGWDVGEYKALQEVFNENDYKFLAFSLEGRQATIQLT